MIYVTQFDVIIDTLSNFVSKWISSRREYGEEKEAPVPSKKKLWIENALYKSEGKSRAQWAMNWDKLVKAKHKRK